MNLAKTFELFNAGRFVVYSCLLIFSVLISLWFDGAITWRIWAVFLPLWIWKFVLVVASLSGIIAWCARGDDSRYDRSTFIQFRAMIISTSLHLMLVLFEVLVCVRLESSDIFPWTLVFVPLMFMSLLCVLLCLWAIKNERSFELEMICSINIVQIVFISIKLDGFITWTWMLVFIPLWVTMVVALIFMLYAIIVAIILMRSVDVHSEPRRVNLSTAISYIFVIVPLVTYLILLVERLDGFTDHSYATIGLPLYTALLTLLIMSFSARPGNIWWFGIRKDFCQFIIIDACPFLQEYGNISYKIHSNENTTPRDRLANSNTTSANTSSNKADSLAPNIVIAMPD